MKRSRILFGTLAVATIALGLSGCGNKATQDKQSSSNATSQQSNNQSSALWNNNKSQELDKFMKQWAPTMHQSYTKYNGSTDLKTASGSQFPSDFKKSTVNNSNDSIGWNPKGKGTYDYNVVAIYNYNRSGAPVGGHITYAFAFHNGQPVALVDETTNGNANWTETKNTDLQGNFARIAKGQSISFKANNANQQTNKQASNDSGHVHLNGGQDSIDYITQKMGDQGWTIEGGTYGGAHGGSSIPYNSVRNSNGDVYYVYQNGAIKKQDDGDDD